MPGTNIGFLREAYEAIENLNRASTTDEVVDVTQRALARFGIEFFCFNTFPNPSQRFEDVMLAIRVPEEWRRLYLEKRYVHVDPTIRYCKRTDAPFVWKDAPYDSEREPLVTEFIERVADFGLSNGFWFPIPGPRGSIGGVWMGGRAADLTGCNLSILHLIALYAFDRLRRLRAPASPGCMRLTIREREVLTWAAQGKSAWEIGEILGIAKRTVDEHAQTACRKLNAVNRTQAVVAALRERLIAA
ncbi:MAG: LuxR family transcriptional regulator [Xanthobacteraceae bacterium]